MTFAHPQPLAADPASVRTARHAVTEVVRGTADSDVVDRVLLCTSEIVTNAIEHGSPPIDLNVRVADAMIRVEVGDSSPRRPRIGDPGPAAIRGRGLLIVDRCADRWGVTGAETGKVVWFEVGLGQ